MKTLKIPIYGYKLHIALGEDPGKIITYINRRVKKAGVKLDENDITQIKTGVSPNHLGFYFQTSINGNGVIWLDPNLDLKDKKTFVTLSHEVIHLCIEIFEYVGSEVNLQTQEHFCYLHDHIMEKCLEELEKYGNNNTSKKSIGVV